LSHSRSAPYCRTLRVLCGVLRLATTRCLSRGTQGRSMPRRTTLNWTAGPTASSYGAGIMPRVILRSVYATRGGHCKWFLDGLRTGSWLRAPVLCPGRRCHRPEARTPYAAAGWPCWIVGSRGRGRRTVGRLEPSNCQAPAEPASCLARQPGTPYGLRRFSAAFVGAPGMLCLRRCKSSAGGDGPNRKARQGCPSRDGIWRKPMPPTRIRRTETGYKASVVG